MALETLQRRMTAFVDWIATDPDREDEIRDQSDSIRSNIKAKAAADGVVVRSTPNSGSFAKHTGLRRHMRGHSVVEGQDVDLPFVVSPKTKDEEELEALLPRFERYAGEAYPDTEREVTKSSVRLKFANQLYYDLVPVLATSDPERQILIRSNGDRRETSLQRHVEFIKTRTQKSSDQAGRVKFNEVVRLGKWWRCFRVDDSSVLTEVPTFLVDLLFACAFDRKGVQPGYAQTFADWCGVLARVTRERALVAFGDFQQAPSRAPAGVSWAVLDPVNATNNIVESWGALKCDEVSDWFTETRDTMYDAIALHEQGEESKGLEHLVAVFGAPFRHHCGESR